MNTITQCLVRWLGRKSRVYNFLEYVQPWSIVAAAISAVWVFGVLIWEQDERHQRQIWEAWLVVNSAHDGRGSAGRQRALEYLAEEGESLDGIIIGKADMPGIDLEGANLTRAIICDANLSGANFRNTNLTDVDMRAAVVKGANFTGATFTGARLGGLEQTESAIGLDTDDAKPALGHGGGRWRDSKHPCQM